jgi:osmotically-inducible protein OsmY
VIPIRSTCAALALLSAAGALTACAPLILGGAMVGGGLVYTDRRTTGAQVEDESIELKAKARLRALATLGRIAVTSYNRSVLLTGEVPGEAEKSAAEQAVAAVENVRAVVNEIAVLPNSSFGTRSSDAVLVAKVKATMVDAKDIQATAFRVVAERGVVYLMGRVSEREAARGAELARSVPGVQKVVRVFEILSEEELANLGRASAPALPASAGSKAPPA